MKIIIIIIIIFSFLIILIVECSPKTNNNKKNKDIFILYEIIANTDSTELRNLNNLKIISSDKLIFNTTFEFMINKDNLPSPYSYPGKILIKNLDLPERNWKILILDSLYQKKLYLQIKKLPIMKVSKLDVAKILSDFKPYKGIYYVLLFNEFGKSKKKRILYE